MERASDRTHSTWLQMRTGFGRERQDLSNTHGLGNSSPLPLPQEVVMSVKEEGDLNLSKQLFPLHNSRVTGLQSALNELIHAKKEGKQILSVNIVWMTFRASEPWALHEPKKLTSLRPHRPMGFLSVASCSGPFLSLLPSERLFEAPAWRSTWVPLLPVFSFWNFRHDSAAWLCAQVHGKDSMAAQEGCTGSTCWWLSAVMFPSAASHYPRQGSLVPVYRKQCAITPDWLQSTPGSCVDLRSWPLPQLHLLMVPGCLRDPILPSEQELEVWSTWLSSQDREEDKTAERGDGDSCFVKLTTQLQTSDGDLGSPFPTGRDSQASSVEIWMSFRIHTTLALATLYVFGGRGTRFSKYKQWSLERRHQRHQDTAQVLSCCLV